MNALSAADLVDSRGCEARCAYCCVAAHSEAAARETGVRYRRRSIDEIAGEVATLHHGKGARVFTVMDDNLLPLDPAEAASFLRSLRNALARRQVGPIALSLQLRADVVSEEVADELAALGLARAYVGIDGYSSPMLKSIGRKAPAPAGPLALERLARRGIFSVCNALLLGPTVPFDTLLDEIDALAAVRHAPVHLLPIDVRAGTRYAERAERLGLVEGGYLHRHRSETPFQDDLARPADLAVPDLAVPEDLAEPPDVAVAGDLVFEEPFLCCPEVREVLATLDGAGCVGSLSYDDGGVLPPDLEQCVLSHMEGHCYPSLANRTVTLFTSHCWIA